jgi:hypothetical protein
MLTNDVLLGALSWAGLVASGNKALARLIQRLLAFMNVLGIFSILFRNNTTTT